jgi:hypothetical protein
VAASRFNSPRELSSRIEAFTRLQVKLTLFGLQAWDFGIGLGSLDGCGNSQLRPKPKTKGPFDIGNT